MQEVLYEKGIKGNEYQRNQRAQISCGKLLQWGQRFTEKVADMIKKDFESGAYDEPEEEVSVDWGMDSPAM